MAVLLYQIGILFAITIASYFGKKSRNTAMILILIFTILQVFMSWLLILQFVTVFIGYLISESILNNTSPNKNVQLKSYSNDYGLTPENPVLLSDKKSCYRYVNGLKTFDEHLSYSRTSKLKTDTFKEEIEVYDFTRKEMFFCRIFIYPFSVQEKIEVPKPFKDL